MEQTRKTVNNFKTYHNDRSFFTFTTTRATGV